MIPGHSNEVISNVHEETIMALIIPSSLTEAESSQLDEIFENSSEAIEALESGTLPEGIPADDIILWALSENNDGSWLDPENANLEYLWTDAVLTALDNVRMLNMANSEFDNLINDIVAFQNAAGQPANAINDAAKIIEDYIAQYGPIMTEGTEEELDTEMQNLIEFFKNTNPYIYLLLYVMNKLGPEIEEGQKVLLEKTEENCKTLADLVDGIEDYNMEDFEDQAALKADEYTIQNIKESQTVLDETLKLLSEFVESALELASSGIQRTSSATRTIIQNMG